MAADGGVAESRSLLDRMIDRLTVQRNALAWAQRAVAGHDGMVLEVGLGKGRTFDHLRHLFPPRDILVFDMWVRVPPDLTPDEDRLFVGDFQETMPAAAERFAQAIQGAHDDGVKIEPAGAPEARKDFGGKKPFGPKKEFGPKKDFKPREARSSSPAGDSATKMDRQSWSPVDGGEAMERPEKLKFAGPKSKGAKFHGPRPEGGKPPFKKKPGGKPFKAKRPS